MEILSKYIRKCSKLSSTWQLIQWVSLAVIIIFSLSEARATINFISKSWSSSSKSLSIDIPEMEAADIVSATSKASMWIVSGISWWWTNFRQSLSTSCDFYLCEQLIQECTQDAHTFERCAEVYFLYLSEE